jgi:hypothetical protein
VLQSTRLMSPAFWIGTSAQCMQWVRGKVAYLLTMVGTQDVREAGLQQAVSLLGASPEDRIPLRLCLLGRWGDVVDHANGVTVG